MSRSVIPPNSGPSASDPDLDRGTVPRVTDRPQLLDRRLLFVTGKGGVGKTSIAAALGFLAAAEGRRTLLCEVDSKGNLADFFGLPPLRFTLAL